jgi:hypothetical protein
MTPQPTSPRDVELARALITELVGTGLSIAGAFRVLLEELPEDAFPGEDGGQVLLGMAAGSCAPVVQAAGEALCNDAIGLVAAIGDRFLDELRAAAAAAS